MGLEICKADSALSDKPLIELGFGLLYTRVFDYPGSDQEFHLTIPFPVGVYRGAILRSGRSEGVRGRFLRNEYIELGLNYDGSFSPPGKKNPHRRGMSELQTVGEIGPAITLHFWETPISKLSWLSGYRKAFNTGFKSIHGRGFSLGSQLNSEFHIEGIEWITVNLKLGLKYANQELMAYYYQVSESEATQNRASYQARAGLMYQFATVSWVAEATDTLTLFASLIVFSFHNAANRSSPLMRADRNNLLSIGFVRSVYQSEEKGWN